MLYEGCIFITTEGISKAVNATQVRQRQCSMLDV